MITLDAVLAVPPYPPPSVPLSSLPSSPLFIPLSSPDTTIFLLSSPAFSFPFLNPSFPLTLSHFFFSFIPSLLSYLSLCISSVCSVPLTLPTLLYISPSLPPSLPLSPCLWDIWAWAIHFGELLFSHVFYSVKLEWNKSWMFIFCVYFCPSGCVSLTTKMHMLGLHESLCFHINVSCLFIMQNSSSWEIIHCGQIVGLFIAFIFLAQLLFLFVNFPPSRLAEYIARKCDKST